MNRLFIKYILCFSFLLIALITPWDLIWSCGPTLAPDESRFALFSQGLDKGGLRPFHYSETLFNFTEPDPDKADYKRNCAEWCSFGSNVIKVADIYTVQYQTVPGIFLTAYRKTDWKGFKNNTFINWLLKKENRPALDYMVLAKEAESTQFNETEPDPWDTTAVQTSSSCAAIAVRAKQALQLPLPVFLKERYAFQAIKMLYYSRSTGNSSAQLHKLYEDYLQNSKSVIAAWALVYYGMTQYNTNRRTTFLLNAFDRSEEKKEFCYLRVSNNELAALDSVTNDWHLKMLINTFKAIKNKGKALDLLKAVFRTDPNSLYLPLLITREINKLENWLWSPEMLLFPLNYRAELEERDSMTISFSERLKQKDRQYLRLVRAYIESIAGKSTTHRIFLQLCLTHLYNMEENFTKAQETLRKLNPVLKPAYEIQRLIEQIITTSRLENILDASIQEKLAAGINRLIALKPDFTKQLDKSKYNVRDHQAENESDDDVSELLVLLSHCFERRNDKLTAGLLYNKANLTVNSYDGGTNDPDAGYRNIAYYDRYCSAAEIDQLIAFKHIKNKTPFQQLISPQKWGLDDHYKDLKGTILFRQKKYREALSVFQSMEPDFWVKHYEFKDYLPKTSVTHTGEMIPSEKTTPALYRVQSKMLIVKDIVDLLDAIQAAKNNSRKSELYYKLANAYFNTSYHGKAWMMFSYGKSTGESSSWEPGNYDWAWFGFYPNNIKYDEYYYQCNDAVDMFKKALLLTADKELAAKCVLQLAFCDKIKSRYMPANVNTRKVRVHYNGEYYSSYLAILKSKYSSTATFRQAAVECPDVRNFLAK